MIPGPPRSRLWKLALGFAFGGLAMLGVFIWMSTSSQRSGALGASGTPDASGSPTEEASSNENPRDDRPSVCFGTSAQGALRDGWKLPRRGANFRAYSDVGWLAGRTFVHSAVHAVVIDAYRRVAAEHPEYRFVYGETGFAAGGSFKPHRTHQNGLSADFMVPVRDASGAIVELPTSAFQKFGYDLEFDDSGALDAGSPGELRIDFEAIALHLALLKRSAASRRVRIARVIFDPELRSQLTRTRAWSSIKDLPFMLKSAWIRHDEHYHVDFDVACRPLAEQAK